MLETNSVNLKSYDNGQSAPLTEEKTSGLCTQNVQNKYFGRLTKERLFIGF